MMACNFHSVISKVVKLVIVYALVSHCSAAVSIGFTGFSDGSAIGSASTFIVPSSGSLSSDSSIGYGDGISLSQKMDANLLGIGSLTEYHEQRDLEGNAVAVYAFMTNSDHVTYSYDAFEKSGGVYAAEKVVIVNGSDPFFGGFANNSRGDYASAQLLGGSRVGGPNFTQGKPVSMTYINNIKATSTEVSATQSLTGAKGDFISWNWASNGDTFHEVLNRDGLFSKGNPVVGPDMYRHQEATAKPFQQHANTNMQINLADIPSYVTTAKSGKSGAMASHSLMAKPFLYLSIETLAGRGYYHVWYQYADVMDVASCGDSVKLTAAAQSTTTTSKVTHSINIPGADYILKHSRGFYTFDYYDAFSVLYTTAPHAGDDKIAKESRAYLVSSDTAAAGVKFGSVSDKVTVKGAHINRGYFGDGLHGYMDKLPTAEAWVGTEIGTTSSIGQNSLTGSSSLTVSEKNWIKISGSWVGKAAPGDTVHRYAGGKVGANSTGLHHWSPGSLKFKESAIASPWSLEVA